MTTNTNEVLLAKKFLALAVTAFANKQYEDAGSLFVQAAESTNAQQLVNALLEPTDGHVPGSQEPILTGNTQQLSCDNEEGEEDENGESAEGDENAESESTSSDEWGDEDAPEEGNDGSEEAEEESGESESNSSDKPVIKRRKVTSLAQIGKMIAASMEATASEEDGSEVTDTSDEDTEEDDENVSLESDADLPGEDVVPVSFSAVTFVKGSVNSPVKLKE